MNKIELILKPILDSLEKSSDIERPERKWDTALSREIVKDFKKGPEELAKASGAKNRDVTLRRLRASKLNHINWRENYIRRTHKMAQAIVSADNSEEFMENIGYFRRYNASDITAKIFWIILTEKLRGDASADELAVRCNALLRKVRRSTLYDLFFTYEVYQKGGRIGGGFDLERFFYKIEQFTYLLNSEYNSDIPEGGRKILLEVIESKNDILRSMEEEVLNIGNSVRELVKSIVRQERSKIFQEMNRQEYGHLLDTIYKITVLVNKEDTSDSELKNFLLLFRKFMKAMKLAPLERPGKELIIPIENLSSYSYVGDPVKQDETSKRVVVTNPGWKLGNQTIIKTAVRELKEQ